MADGGGVFGEFFKNRRMSLGMTLRGFCSKNGFDPSNVSKIERGVWPPPEGDEDRKKYAQALGLRPGSPDWQRFMDLASAGTGTFKVRNVTDEDVLERLPVLFRSVDKADLSAEQLDRIIEFVKKSETK